MASLAAFAWSSAGPGLCAIARAEDAASEVERLDKSALEAYDNLNFEQARKQLSQALDLCDSRELGPDLTAKTHLYLGMILIAAFNEKSEARLHFQSALKLKPDLVAPKSLFNPEAQALFDEVKASAQTSSSSDGQDEEEQGTSPPPPPVVRRAPPPKKRVEEEDDEAPVIGSGVFLSLGGGFGFGLANSTLETNRASLVSGGGGLTSEKPAHIFGEFGYSMSSSLMLSLQLRLGILAGTNQVNSGEGCSLAFPCHPPTSAFAGIAKATWFFGPGDTVVPFLTAGLGAGVIRHVVEIRLESGDGDCGMSGMAACVDTVKGGPFLVVAGAGMLIRATENFGFSLGLQAEAGLPKMMLNADLNGGAVVQF